MKAYPNICTEVYTVLNKPLLTHLQEIMEYHLKNLERENQQCVQLIGNLSPLQILCKNQSYHNIKEHQKAMQRILSLGKPITGESRTENIESHHSLQKLISEYGTKTAHILQYLDQLLNYNLNAQALLISENYEYLLKIGSLLKTYKIENSVLGENVDKQALFSILNSFRDKNLRILLMSLNFTTSTNPTLQATHILFLSPFEGNKNQILADEAKVIGNCSSRTTKLTLVRFILLDTYEQTHYENTFGPIDGIG